MKKILLYFVSAAIIIFVLLLLIASPLLKHLLQRYDVVYLGREISIESIQVNLITGAIQMDNVQVFELGSDKVFISARSIKVNISIMKLLFHECDLSYIEIDHPEVRIIKNRSFLNYDDLLLKIDNRNKLSDTPMKISWERIQVSEGKLVFQEDSIAVKCGFVKVNLEVKNMSTKPGFDLDFKFENGLESGRVNGGFAYSYADKKYQLALHVKQYDLNIVQQYFKVLIPDVRFKATLEADFRSQGILGEKEDVTNSGLIRITNLHCAKDSFSEFISLRELELSLKEISPKKKIFTYDSVIVRYPYVNYVKYDHLDNFQNFFGINGSRITKVDSTEFNLVTELVSYLKMLSRNFKKSDYLVDRFRIESGDLNITDLSKQREFYVRLYPINLSSMRINKKSKRINASLNVHTFPHTNLKMQVAINPLNYNDFELQYDLKGLSLGSLNPYLTPITSFPFEKGTLDCFGSWLVDDGKIDSENHLVLNDPKLSKRVKSESNNRIPMRVLLRMMRNSNGTVESDLSITGNLSDPSFDLKKAVWEAMMHHSNKERTK